MKYLDIEDTLQNEALRIVHQLNPEDMEYDQWFGVGAALKGCGCAVKDWDDFSKLDPRRYHAGECERKWAGMRGTVIGALYALMRDMGVIDIGNELDWDDEILVGGVETPRLAKSHEESFLHLTDESKDETITQLGALFEEGELVCYVNRLTLRANGKYEPENKGHYGRTCAQLIRDLEASSDIGGALGDYTPEAGALVHVNPVNGGGVGNKYIVVFRHALVECDEGDLQSQLEKILELNLPCARVVFSGSRSIHAAVRVDAKDCGQYGERVEFLYDFCSKHGLKVDTGCKDPARMMRLAGATRKGVRQKLIATHVGCSSWDEWYGWATGSVMPEIVNLGSIWHRLPPLAPEMIEGTLRVGHKMLVAGPSKAGKSFLLIQLAVAVAEGSAWLGKSCRQGKVLYINLEVDAASCMRRFEDVYGALGTPASNVRNIDVLNLRGHGMPLDKLVPVILGACEGTEYAMVIIDPIYKVITGDENSATDMAYFTAQLDVIADRMGCCVVYAHHHSKGKQGWKYSMDRMSGSGVFARDPDAILDMSLLVCGDEQVQQAQDLLTKKLVRVAMDKVGVDVAPDSFTTDSIERWALRELPTVAAGDLMASVRKVTSGGVPPVAYRINYNLREFRSPSPTDLWFAHPVHVIDTEGVLSGCRVDGEPGRPKLPKPSDGQQDDPFEDIEFAFGLVSMGEPNARIQDLADWLGVSVKTAQRRLDKDGRFERAHGLTWLKVV